MPASHQVQNDTWVRRSLWVIIVLFTGATFLPLFPQGVPPRVIVACHIVPTALFALVHGARVYRLRGIIIFALFSIIIGNLLETVGVLTGFPFGQYSFTDRMGPKLLLVPILMGPAYFGMGYLSWTVARLILGRQVGMSKLRVVVLPLAAAFVMVAWDLSIDPVLSTLGRYWIWQHGGPYFGVPISNFLGWYLTNYVVFQAFALYQFRRSPFDPGPSAYSGLAVLLYAVTAAGNVLRLFSTSGGSTVSDPAGVPWSVKSINGVSAVASLFIMGAFALFAWIRLMSEEEISSGSVELAKTTAAS